MSFMKKLYSRNFFLLNLVVLGVLLGFALAFTGFSFAGRASAGPAPGLALAAESPIVAEAPKDVRDAIAQAEGVQKAFRYVASKVLPSVVQLNVVEKKRTQASPDQQLPWPFFFGQPQDEAPAPREFQERGLGSGIVVRKDGRTAYVLTNAHVAGSASEITVVLYDGREFKGSLVGSDERKDLALVKFEADSRDIVVAGLGDSSSLAVGDWAIAIGSPFGLVSSVTAGIVSAIGRTGGPDGNISDFIQTDAAINKGNPGGALVNIQGEVVGINTWIASPTGGSIGLGFAVPINNAKKAIDDFISKGSVEYGWLGVSLRELDKASAEELGVDPKKGAFVAHVFEGSPAAKGGFLPGDFVMRIDGRDLKGQDDLVRTVGDLAVGKRTQATVLRDGKRVELNVTIEARVATVASNDGNIFPGLDVVSLKSEALDAGKLPKDAKGVAVINVLPRSPAATIGLKPGDIVTAVNEREIKDLPSFYRLMNDPKEKKLSFAVIREGQTLSTLAYVRK